MMQLVFHPAFRCMSVSLHERWSNNRLERSSSGTHLLIMAQAQDDDAACAESRRAPFFKGTDYSSRDYWEQRFAATAAIVKSAEQQTSEADGAEFD